MSKGKRLKLSLPRLVMLTLVFVLGFLGIGLVQNISSADDTNPTRNTTVDCNFYIFIHDEDGNPVENVVVNAYSNQERTDLVGTSQPSNNKGWAHITTCTTEFTGEYRAMVYFAPDINTLPEGQKNYQAGDADVLINMVNADALERGFLGEDDDEYSVTDYIQGTTEVDTKDPVATKAVTSLGTVFPGQDLEADGIVGYDAARYESWFYAAYMFASFKILPGEPEQPVPEPDLGNLSISKTTSDNNTSTSFNVRITLSGTSTDGQSANTISGTYGDATFDDGIATISIKHNQTKNITGLPAGINYSIEETNPGDYAATYTNQTGTIIKDQTTTASINNLKEEVGNLRITKKIDGFSGQVLRDEHYGLSNEFNITVSLSGSSLSGRAASTINGTYGGVEFVNGVGNIVIKWDTWQKEKTVYITGLPAGLDYRVDEEEFSEYNTSYTNKSGTITKNSTKSSTVTNTYNEIIIEKGWWYPDKFGTTIYNEQTGEWEYRIIDGSNREEINVEATFEIRFDSVPDGEYEMIGATDNILTVRNNRGTFTIRDKLPDQYFSYMGSRIREWSSIVRIKGVPIGVQFSIDEISARSIDDNIPMDAGLLGWNSLSEPDGKVGSFGLAQFRNGLGQRADALQYKLNFTKKVLNAKPEDLGKEYEFTILPLYDVVAAGFDQDHEDMVKVNADMAPGLMYSVRIHGEDGEKIVDSDWFAEYIRYFWSGLLWYDFYSEQYNKDDSLLLLLWRLDNAIHVMHKPEFYADSQEVEKVVEYFNSANNNFFEYEGIHLIEVSQKLEAKINSLGYESTSEWFRGTYQKGQNASSDDEKLEIINELIDCFTETGWTVDDFRLVNWMNTSGLLWTGYDGHYTPWYEEDYGTKSLYDAYNDPNDFSRFADEYRMCYRNNAYSTPENRYNSPFKNCDGTFDLNTNQYFFGRTFKLKDGESIQLNFPAWWAYASGAMIIEKRTGEEDYTQDIPTITNILHVEKDANGDYVANATYKNTYPEPEPEEEPEPEVPPKEIPVESVNPRTGDIKILPLIIMAGSALVLALGLLGLRRFKKN